MGGIRGDELIKLNPPKIPPISCLKIFSYEILTEFFRDKNGELLTESKKKKWLEELKERGLTNRKQNFNYTFDFVVKFCRKNNICEFVYKRASKQDISQDNELEYRKK